MKEMKWDILRTKKNIFLYGRESFLTCCRLREVVQREPLVFVDGVWMEDEQEPGGVGLQEPVAEAAAVGAQGRSQGCGPQVYL